MDVLTSNTYLFSYGLVIGLFFATAILLLFHLVLQLALPKKEVPVIKVFGYGLLASLGFGLFNIYAIPLHFAAIEPLFSANFYLVARLFSVIAIFATFQMFLQALPIKTVDSFLYWYKSKLLYKTLYLFFLLIFISFFIITDRKTVVILTLSTYLASCVLGLFFSHYAFNSKRYSWLYSTTLATMIIIFLVAIYLIYITKDLSEYQSLFMLVHSVMAILVLLMNFILLRVTLDENIQTVTTAKSNIEDFYKNIYFALQNEEFYLEYQPKINIATQQVSGFEALIRWQHPKKGLINPQEFIPLSEQTELMNDITQWVIKTAVADQKKMMEVGIQLPLSINYSVKNINATNVGYLIDTLNLHQVNPKLLTVEITESLFFEMTESQKHTLILLREAGINLSLDDFGAGHSSLRHLDEMGLNEVKLDRVFCENLFHQKKYTLVSALIEMCHSLGISVVAEGVNEKEVCEILNQMRCDMAQGFGIARPMRINDFHNWYNNYTHAFEYDKG